VNFRQLQQQVQNRARINSVQEDNHTSQMVREVINGIMQDILSRQQDWGFLHRTAEILTEVDEIDYALPTDFGNLERVSLDGVLCQIFNSQDVERFTGSVTRVSTQFPAATIRDLTVSPFFSQGIVFPTFNSSQIGGVGTNFQPTAVNRFFKTDRDGELYRVKAFVDITTLTLAQEYRGRSVAGRVQTFTEDLTIVHGDVGVTNFTEDMTGLRMQVEGNGTNTFEIDTVDEIKQLITLVSAVTAAGSDLIYSIQDTFEIDPPGLYILQVFPTPTVVDDTIVVQYNALHTDLTGDSDQPLIPRNFHQTIVFGATAEVMRITNWPSNSTIQMYERRYERGVASMQTNDDPLGTAIHYSAEPDVVRHQRTNLTN